ncbi:MAG: S8 family serine peptidase [Bacteroidales bacterium]
MKKFYFSFLLAFIISSFLSLSAQNTFLVQRGERPFISLQTLPNDAYEQGILKIKLSESLSKHLDETQVHIDAQGFVRFNIPAIDDINQAEGARNFLKTFDSDAFSTTFTDRHRAWGFHLWYTLYFDEKADIRALVMTYQGLSEVEIAEPEYKKQLVAPIPWKSDITESKTEQDPTDWTPNDPYYSTQWHYHNTGQQSGTPDADIDLPEAWDLEKGNSNVIVAVIDDGIQFNHPDIAANMWAGIGYNFVTGSSTIQPGNHGTHVAGTVSAVNNNGTGVAGVAGGSGSGDGVRLMSCQVFSSSSSGGFHLAPIYAADNGAAISQNSWGYTNPGVYDQSVLDAIDYFNTNGGGTAMINGGITIFAAGNDNSSSNYYPAYYSGTLAVAATNNQDVRSYYSNYGAWVDISAPGGETISVTERGVRSTITGSSYAFYQGTSMACPHASGVAALIISLGFGSFTPADVKNILKNTTDNIDGVNPGYIGQLGTGRANAHSALLETQAMLSGLINPPTFTATPVSTTQINLAWTKNPSNHDVMVAWSSTGTFGTPVNGTIYNAGQSIPGGGTVLYRGSNTAYNHTGLTPSTTYYYKAFSYDASNDYSSGKTAQATTICDIITLPFSENFNAAPPTPPCWEVIDNQGNGQVWQFGTFSGGVSGTGGNYAYLNSDGYGSGNSQNSDLVTPTLDLSGFTNVTLAFQHYFRSYSGSSGALAYSINNGSSWTTIQSWTSSTTNPASFNQVIAAVEGQSQVKFRWKYVGTWGYYWSVDNVSITGTTSASPPVAQFTANNTTPNIGETVTFTDQSTNLPTSWSWTFTPASIDYVGGTNASSQNPQVQFNASGLYTASLQVSNSSGSDTETKVDYIHATQAGLWTGITSTDWNTASNWDDNLVPTAVVDVTIPSTAPNWPGLTSDLVLGTTCNNLTMIGSSELTVHGHLIISSGKILNCMDSPIIRIGGDWNNMGNFMPGTGTIDFVGNTISSVLGSPAINYLIHENFNMFPGNWTGNVSTTPAADNFYQVTSSNAGGTSPEIRYQKRNGGNAVTRRVVYGPVNTSGLSVLTLDFRHMIDHGSAGYSAKVQYSTNGTTWADAGWTISPSGNIPATNVSVPLNTSFGVGSANYYISFTLTGSLNAINYWYLDDVSLYYASNNDPVEYYNLEISKINAEVITTTDIDIHNQFNIHPGAYFTNSSGNTLNISGQATFMADANGMASFIDHGITTFSLPSQVQLYLTPDSWHFVSSPVNGALSGLFTNNYLYSFDEPTDSWFNIIPTDIPLNDMQGYSVWVPSNPALITFDGDLHNGPFSIPVTRNITQTNQGWNLVGNPYPSSIDWNSAAWTKTNVNNTIYYYQGAGGLNNYRYYVGAGGEVPGIGVNTGTNEVTPLQGFFVHASANGTISVNNDARIHSNQAYYKSEPDSEPEIQQIRIVAESNALTDETVVRFVPEASSDFDGNYDALKLFSSTYPQIYTTSGMNDLAVNTLPATHENLIIPLSFNKPDPGEFSLTFTEIANLPAYNLYLEDLLLNEVHKVSENHIYNFNYSPGNSENRFLLHFSNPLGVDYNTTPSISIYAHGNIVYVNLNESTDAEIIIHDLIGQELYRRKAVNDNLLRILFTARTGYYLVTVHTENQIVTQKILLK